MKKPMIFAFAVVIGLYFTGYALADSKTECIALCEAAAKMMKEIREWYENYPPSPDDFKKWKAGTHKIFEKATIEFKH